MPRCYRLIKYLLNQKGLHHWLVPRILFFFPEQLQTATSSYLRKSFLQVFQRILVLKNSRNFTRKPPQWTTVLLWSREKLYFGTSSSITGTYLEPSRKSMMELFCEKSSVVIYSLKKVSSYVFDWVLNMPLY